MVDDHSKRRFPDRGLMGVRYVDFVPPFDIEDTRAVLDRYGVMYIVAPWGVGKTSLSYWLNGHDEREKNTVILDLITTGLHRANKMSNEILRNIYMYVQSEVDTNADWDTFVPASSGASLFDQFYAAFSPALECERIKTIVLDEVRMMENFIKNDEIEFYDVMVKLCSESGKKLIIISQAPVWQISDNAQRVRGLSDEEYLQNIFDDRTTIAPIPLPYYFWGCTR